MATDSGDLFEQLLFQVALAGKYGLAEEGVEQFVKDNLNKDEIATAPPANPTGFTSPSTEASPNGSGHDETNVIRSIWQRLEDHEDITFRPTNEQDPTTGDEDQALSSAQPTSSEWRVFASQERVWQAVAGHEVDRSRISGMLFEILETVAAHGPNGILQPDMRRVTNQDKHSVPGRTEKLAQKGYILKERVHVQGGNTSRLRLWRWGDRVAQADDMLSYDDWYETLVRILQENGGIAAYSDIQAELDDNFDRKKQKALLRIIVRLESTGLLRRLKAQVADDETMPDAPDRWVRSLQLLREPTQLDRDIVHGKKTGQPKGSKGRPRKVVDVETVENEDDSAAEDAGDQQSDDEGAYTELPQTPRRTSTGEDAAHMEEQSQYVQRAADTNGLLRGDGSLKLSASPAKGTKRKLTEADNSSNSTRSPRPTKRHRVSTYNEVEIADDVFGPVSALQAPGSPKSPQTTRPIRPTKSVQPGVHFAPRRVEKGKGPGRPKKSLVAVFRSGTLRDKAWFNGNAATSLNVQEAPAEVTASTNFTPQIPGTPGTSSVLAAPPRTEEPPQTPAFSAAEIPPPAEFRNAQPSSSTTPAKSLSKASLGQIRRKERECAEKAAAAAAAAAANQPQDPATLIKEASAADRVAAANVDPQLLAPPLDASQRSGDGQALALGDESTEEVSITTGQPSERTPLEGQQGAFKSPREYQSYSTQNAAGTPFANEDNHASPRQLVEYTLPPSPHDASDQFNAGQSGVDEQHPSPDPQTVHEKAAKISSQNRTSLPPLHFVDVRQQYRFADAAALKGPKIIQGPIHQQRCDVVMSVVRSAGGVFSGAKEIRYPFTTQWMKTHSEAPDIRTVARIVDTLTAEGELKKYEFNWTFGGVERTLNILTEPDIDPSSEKVRGVQRKMLEVWPDIYMPEGVEVAPKLRLSGRVKSVATARKRPLKPDSNSEGPSKRRKTTAADADEDWQLEDEADDDDNSYTVIRGERQYTNKFPEIAGMAVKRTTAGIKRSDAEAQANGFADLKTRLHAKAHLPQNEYHSMRQDALNEGRIISADEVRPRSSSHAPLKGRSLDKAMTPTVTASSAAASSVDCGDASTIDPSQSPAQGHDVTMLTTPTDGRASASDAAKKKGGWPKGKPRGPRPSELQKRFAVSEDATPLLSLLFFPEQLLLSQCGTIGTLPGPRLPKKKSTKILPPSHDAIQTLPTNNSIGSPSPAAKYDSRTRAPKSAYGAISRFHTDYDRNPESAVESVGRAEVAPNPVMALLLRPGQKLLKSSWTFGTNSFIVTTHHYAGEGRGKRIRKFTEKAASMNVPSATPESLEKVAAFKQLHPPPKPAMKPVDFDDLDGLVSTEHTKIHSDKTWHHLGSGRWAEGLPPPGSSYRTAVRGPDAHIWLDQVRELGPIPRKQGPVIDGVRYNLDGTVRKLTPTHPPKPPKDPNGPPKPRKRNRSSTSKSVKPSPLVQYETPDPSPQAGYEVSMQTTPYQHHLSPVSTYEPESRPSSSYVPMAAPYFVELPQQQEQDQQDQQSRASTPASTLNAEASVAYEATGLPTPNQSQTTANGVKTKRPYTYKSRKRPLSEVDKDGMPVEIDRASDDDYRQGSSPKKQRKQKQQPSGYTPKTISEKDRVKLSAAIALVRNLSGASSHKEVPWDLIARALQQNDDGAAASQNYQAFARYGPYAKFLNAIQEHMQEPFLAAMEKDELPHIDLAQPTKNDWPGLLVWVETNVVPLVTEDVVKNARKATELYAPPAKKEKGAQKGIRKPQQKRAATDVAVFPATYGQSISEAAKLDLNEGLITAKTWIRANSTTKDEVYDATKATEKLAMFGNSVVQAVKEMQDTSTIRMLKSGRQRPGRNFEITQHTMGQFSRWPPSADGSNYMQGLADARAKVVQHFAENETMEPTAGTTERETLILNSMVAQGLLQMETRLPPRNDDVDAPFPKLNAWSYGGPRHDTRKIDRSIFDLPVMYTKTSAFTTEHGLKTGVPIPGPPPPVQGDPLPRIPFWIDIHDNVIPEIWEKVLSSILFLLVRKPGTTAKSIERAHDNKLWAWEVEMALGWMEKVGVAERIGAGREVEGVWKGGWGVGEEWFCVFGEGMKVWR